MSSTSKQSGSTEVMDNLHKAPKYMGLACLQKYITFILFAAIIFGLFLMAKKNQQDFEDALVKQSQRQLLTIAKAETQHFKSFIFGLQDELRILALNPQTKELINSSVDSGIQHDEGD